MTHLQVTRVKKNCCPCLHNEVPWKAPEVVLKQRRDRTLTKKQGEKRKNMLQAESHIPQTVLCWFYYLGENVLQQLPKRAEEEEATWSDRKNPKQLLFSSLRCMFSERKGVAVKQGAAEENCLSEIILLSWSCRLSSGLESLSKVPQTTFHLAAATALPV